MSQKDKKVIAFLIVLPITALLSRNWGAAVGIFVAFWAGGAAVYLPGRNG